MAGHYPQELRYTKDHEWARFESDDSVVIGITDHAQRSLGDIVYLELPKVGQQLKRGDSLGVVESIKAVSDIYAPVTGVVQEVHSDLTNDPGQINSDPYHNGWLVRLKVTDKSSLDDMMDAKSYEKLVQSLS